MNTMFASGGYPWTVVELKRRKEYINSLEHAHTENDIYLFVRFILEEMRRSKKLWGKKINFSPASGRGDYDRNS